MPNILGLKDWNVTIRQENDHDMAITAEYAANPTVCLRCGVESPRLKKYGVQEQTFMDTPIHGKRVGIKIMRQRYKCLECEKTFQQQLPDMDEKRTMTRRLLAYIRRRSLERTFTEVASDVGLDERTIRNIFNDYVDELNDSYWPQTPNWLGIDELFLVRKPRCIFTNVQANTIIDMLPNRDKVSVAKWLSQRPHKEVIEVVTMDMWKPYRDAVTANLPGAKVVVDKFHVVKLANHCLDTVRKSLREGMDLKQRRKLMHDRHLILRRRKNLEPMDFMMMQAWTDSIPALFSAYQAKEDFYDIWDTATSRAEAMELYDLWKATLEPKTRSAFYELIRAVDNWRFEVFNYFDFKGATNAYTESANGLAKIANRLGRGYSFEAIRAKVLFGQAKHVMKPKFGTGEWELIGSRTEDAGVSVPDLVTLYFVGHGCELNTLESE